MQVLLTLIEHYGLWLVFANVLVLQLGLPVPAYPTLVLVAAASAHRSGGLVEIVLVGTAASLIADSVWYFIGGRLGRRVLKLMCRLSLSPDSCVRQTESIYARWGAPSLLFAKFVPGFSAVATSMAGLMKTRLSSFVAYDAVGAMVWCGVAVVAGWLFRDAVSQVIVVFRQAGLVGLALIAALLALYLLVKLIQRHRLLRTLRMARVSVDELQAMIASGDTPLIVDVRSPSSQPSGRIPGALWINGQTFESSLREHGLEDRIGHDVIVYCACPNEASAAMVAKKLMRAGFKRVRPLAGGIDAWIGKGYAIDSSTTPPAREAESLS